MSASGGMKTDFDTVIVGAGPSGVAAAYALHQSGHKVLLIDKRRFPRVKPCGGAISMRSLAVLPWSPGDSVERWIDRMNVGARVAGADRFQIAHSPKPMCGFAVRSEFDRFNLEKTLEAGVAFESECELIAIDERSDLVRVAHTRGSITARYLIGADGANSTVRRLTGEDRSFFRGFALEGLVPYAAIGAEPVTEMFFGYIENGYGWVFPKGDHANVGVYTWDSNVKLSRTQLSAYVAERLNTDKLEHVVGFPLGFGAAGYAPERERVILVGDAAGCVEPLLGEGIYNAIRSGQAAALAIKGVEEGRESNLPEAYRACLHHVRNDLNSAEQTKTAVYSNPNILLDGVVTAFAA
jgi:geranylgeranyl reductase family protein